jgi:endonuclease/exonuclease/phosphatase family metal-dependent hydrolase
VRVVTLNLLTYASADGPARHQVVKRELPNLSADVVALQEVTRRPGFDQAADLLGAGYEIVDLPGGDPTYGGECLAARGSAVRIERLDEPLAGAGGSRRASAAAVEVVAPDVGNVLVVHHKGTFELTAEHVRERQAVATARFVEDLLRDRPGLPVVLLGDFNAAPDSAGIRFLTGRQSLDGFSVRYEDAWTARHGAAPGLTFDPRNPLVRAGQLPSERGRRIDYVLIRSGVHGPPLDVADCRLLFTDAVDGTWASDHFGLLADLRRPDHEPGQWANG